MSGNLIGIAGVYGKNNLGDEALLHAVKADVLSILPDSRIIAFCSDPQEVTRQHGIDAVSRKPFKDFRSKYKLLKQMDAFIIGGGTLLYEQGSVIKNIKAILAFYFWPVLAKILKIKTIAYGQGLGPVNSFTMKLAVSLLPVVFDLITLRDKQSYGYLKQHTDCFITSDPVVASDSFCKVASDSADKDSYLLLAFRFPQAAERDLVEKWVQSISTFAKINNCKIVLFPTQLSHNYFEDELLLDEEYATLVSHGVNPDHVSKATWSTMEEGIAQLQGARLVVSNRLHALLLAAKAGVAVVGLGGKDKIRGCLQMLGLQKPVFFVEQDKVNETEMTGLLDEAWNASREDKLLLQENLSNWIHSEPNNRTLLKKILTI